MKGTLHLFITIMEIIPLPALTLSFAQRKAHYTSAIFHRLH